MAQMRCNLRRVRINNGLTQQDLASAIGVSSVAVSRWENGMRIPNLECAIAVADALECEIRDVWEIVTDDEIRSIDVVCRMKLQYEEV